MCRRQKRRKRASYITYYTRLKICFIIIIVLSSLRYCEPAAHFTNARKYVYSIRINIRFLLYCTNARISPDTVAASRSSVDVRRAAQRRLRELRIYFYRKCWPGTDRDRARNAQGFCTHACVLRRRYCRRARTAVYAGRARCGLTSARCTRLADRDRPIGGGFVGRQKKKKKIRESTLNNNRYYIVSRVRESIRTIGINRQNPKRTAARSVYTPCLGGDVRVCRAVDVSDP